MGDIINNLRNIQEGNPYSIDYNTNITQMIDKSNFDERQYKFDIDIPYECGRARIIEELEKIKTELNNLDFDFGNYYDETEAILYKINSVLDKHIKEINK